MVNAALFRSRWWNHISDLSKRIQVVIQLDTPIDPFSYLVGKGSARNSLSSFPFVYEYK